MPLFVWTWYFASTYFFHSLNMGVWSLFKFERLFCNSFVWDLKQLRFYNCWWIRLFFHRSPFHLTVNFKRKKRKKFPVRICTKTLVMRQPWVSFSESRLGCHTQFHLTQYTRNQNTTLPIETLFNSFENFPFSSKLLKITLDGSQ